MTMCGDASIPMIGLAAVTRKARYLRPFKDAFQAALMATIYPAFADRIGKFAATAARRRLPLANPGKPDARRMLPHPVAQ